jgi:hypothetical protein
MIDIGGAKEDRIGGAHLCAPLDEDAAHHDSYPAFPHS